MEHLWEAVSQSKVHKVKKLLEDKRCKGHINKRTEEGLTALHLASIQGSQEIVEMLLNKGANPNIKDRKKNWTAAHFASYHGKLRVLLLLLPFSKKDTDTSGRTPLDLLYAGFEKRQIYNTVPEQVSNELFTWGSGVNFQLGHGTPDYREQPKLVSGESSFEGKNIYIYMCYLK